MALPHLKTDPNVCSCSSSTGRYAPCFWETTAVGFKRVDPVGGVTPQKVRKVEIFKSNSCSKSTRKWKKKRCSKSFMAKPHSIHGTYSIFTYHLVDFDGLTIGKYTSPMHRMGKGTVYNPFCPPFRWKNLQNLNPAKNTPWPANEVKCVLFVVIWIKT